MCALAILVNVRRDFTVAKKAVFSHDFVRDKHSYVSDEKEGFNCIATNFKIQSFNGIVRDNEFYNNFEKKFGYSIGRDEYSTMTKRKGCFHYL